MKIKRILVWLAINEGDRMIRRKLRLIFFSDFLSALKAGKYFSLKLFYIETNGA